MKKLILFFSLTLTLIACDKIKKAEDNMDGMNAKMDKTNAAVHKQALLVAINEFTKSEKYEKLYPVPTELLAPAKAFAEEADSLELIEFTYAMLKDVVEVLPNKGLGRQCLRDDDVTTLLKELETAAKERPLTLQERQELKRLRKLPAKVVALTCGPDYHQSETEPFVEMDHSLEKLNEVRLRKLGILYSVMTIAGFTPQDRLDEIIGREIHGSGRFEATAKQFLMMRVIFIRDVLLNNSLLSNDLRNSGEIAKAIEYMLSVERVLRLSFAEELSLKLSVMVEGLKDPVIEVDENLTGANLKKAAATWKTILDRATNGVKVYKKASTGNAAEDQRQARAEAEHSHQLILQVFGYGKAWFSDLQLP